MCPRMGHGRFLSPAGGLCRCEVVVRFLPEHTFPSVVPSAPPLSFPPVVSGNPVFFSSVPFIRVTLHGESHGFPIKNVGNDNGGLKTSRMTAGD